mgnify:CR=1 FL=1
MDATEATTDPSSGGVDPLVGKVLGGRFEIEALINRGGMGKIYKATQQPLGRAVALKILDIHDDGSEFRDRFFLEASLCAKLAHPNTIRIFDYGTTDDGIYYIAMEYLSGESLQQILRGGALSVERSISIARQIAGALAEAHDCGIVHRDLKPGNVMVTSHGENEFVKVLDFGLVKELGKESELSRTGTVLGSPLYISPEQVHGDPVDGRADIYTLGLILYALLMGRTTFDRGNPLNVLMQQTQKKPPPFRKANPNVQVPEALEWVVMRCLEKKAAKRFVSMHELIRALKAVEKEMRGEVDDLELSLQDGMLVLPEGMEVSHEVRISPQQHSAATTRLVASDGPSQSTLSSTRPMNTSTMVLLGGGSLAGLGLMAVGGVLLLLVLGAVGWSMMQPAPEVVQAPPPPPQPEVVEKVIQAGPEKVSVTLTSEPPGADVERDGVVEGTTPFTVTLEEGETWTVQVSADGFEPRKVRLSPDVPSPSVKLEKKARRGGGATPAPAPVPTPVPVVLQPEPAPAPAPASPKPAPRGDMRDPWENE